VGCVLVGRCLSWKNNHIALLGNRPHVHTDFEKSKREQIQPIDKNCCRTNAGHPRLHGRFRAVPATTELATPATPPAPARAASASAPTPWAGARADIVGAAAAAGTVGVGGGVGPWAAWAQPPPSARAASARKGQRCRGRSRRNGRRWAAPRLLIQNNHLDTNEGCSSTRE
jgi:hypothetical protein